MAKEILIHKGKHETRIPAKTELVLIEDPENPKFGEYEEREIEPERVETVDLPAGTRFGDYEINVPHEITNPEIAKALKQRGFEKVTLKEGEKYERKLAKDSPEAKNAEIAERDREEAVGKAAIFDKRAVDPATAPAKKSTKGEK